MTPDGFRHEAQSCPDRADLVRSCAELVRDGLTRDWRMLFLLAAATIDEVRRAVGERQADDVTFVDLDEHGRNPARALSLLDSFQATGDGRRCLGVNEAVPAGRDRATLVEAQLADSLLNSPALRAWPMSLTCLYDEAALDAAGRSTMRRSHLTLRGQDRNDDYEPGLGDLLFAIALGDPPGRTERIEVATDDLAAVRRFVRAAAGTHGLRGERCDDLVLAANEIVTNSLRHGGRRCSVQVWAEDATVACEIRDAGMIVDPLLGRLAPTPDAVTGRGLWLAHQLCDLVRIRSSQAGTVIRLHARR